MALYQLFQQTSMTDGKTGTMNVLMSESERLLRETLHETCMKRLVCSLMVQLSRSYDV